MGNQPVVERRTKVKLCGVRDKVWHSTLITLCGRSNDPAQTMGLQTFEKKVPVYCLSSSGALPCRDDHLAIGRGDTACGIDAFNIRLETGIYFDLPFSIHLGAERLRDFIQVDVAASRKESLDRERPAIVETEAI